MLRVSGNRIAKSAEFKDYQPFKRKKAGGDANDPEDPERKKRCRERNRLHARKSRLRKKIFIDSLKQSIDRLEDENRAMHVVFVKVKKISMVCCLVPATFPAVLSAPADTIPNHDQCARVCVCACVPAAAELCARANCPIVPPSTHRREIISRYETEAKSSGRGLPTGVPPVAKPAAAKGFSISGAPLLGGLLGGSAQHRIISDDYEMVKALHSSKQYFVITSPKLIDNPIVYASQTFFELTGYSQDEACL